MSNRQQWLDSLQVGDEIAIDLGRYGRRNYQISKVSRITPTRRFTIEGRSAEFDSAGNERGKKSTWDSRLLLLPVTQEIRDAIRKEYVVARLDSAKWGQLELAKLEKILEALDKD